MFYLLSCPDTRNEVDLQAFAANKKKLILPDNSPRPILLGKRENYYFADAGQHHRLLPPGIRAGPCIAKYLSHVRLNESVVVNNSIKNETFKQGKEFNISFELLNLCSVMFPDILKIKNRCL
jgi:hypothetical protein